MIINCGLEFANTATTMGIRIPKVPHEVPVENARKHPTRKMIAGRNIIRLFALLSIAVATNTAAPKLSVMALRVHAKVRIRIAGTIALKPEGRHSIHSVKERTLRHR